MGTSRMACCRNRLRKAQGSCCVVVVGQRCHPSIRRSKLPKSHKASTGDVSRACRFIDEMGDICSSPDPASNFLSCRTDDLRVGDGVTAVQTDPRLQAKGT